MNKKTSEYFSPRRLFKSFSYAFAGIAFCLRTQKNAFVHLTAAIIVIACGVYFEVSTDDWRWITLCIALVWFAELVNTAFEHLCDVVSPEFSPSVKRSKDIAAGAVLICAAGAAVIGLLTFLPYVLPLFRP